jgi:hypothetical protein
MNQDDELRYLWRTGYPPSPRPPKKVYPDRRDCSLTRNANRVLDRLRCSAAAAQRR